MPVVDFIDTRRMGPQVLCLPLPDLYPRLWVVTFLGACAGCELGLYASLQAPEQRHLDTLARRLELSGKLADQLRTRFGTMARALGCHPVAELPICRRCRDDGHARASRVAGQLRVLSDLLHLRENAPPFH